MASGSVSDARRDDMAAQVVLGRLGRGRDAAMPLSKIAESLGWNRRVVEKAVQDLRLSGHHPVASGPEGVWIGDRKDIADTVESMRRRRLHQALTERALRRWLRQTGEVQQQTLFDAA